MCRVGDGRRFQSVAIFLLKQLSFPVLHPGNLAFFFGYIVLMLFAFFVVADSDSSSLSGYIYIYIYICVARWRRVGVVVFGICSCQVYATEKEIRSVLKCCSTSLAAAQHAHCFFRFNDSFATSVAVSVNFSTVTFGFGLVRF